MKRSFPSESSLTRKMNFQPQSSMIWLKQICLVFLCQRNMVGLAADALKETGAPGGKAYFISNGEPMPVADLINNILAAGGLGPVERRVSPELAYLAGAALEFKHYLLCIDEEPRMTRFVARQLSTEHWFDLSAAKRDLGYAPAVSVADGFERLKKSFSEIQKREATP